MVDCVDGSGWVPAGVGWHDEAEGGCCSLTVSPGPIRSGDSGPLQLQPSKLGTARSTMCTTKTVLLSTTSLRVLYYSKLLLTTTTSIAKVPQS